MLTGNHNYDGVNGPGNNVDGVHEANEEPAARTRTKGYVSRPERNRPRKHIDGYNALDELEDESDATSSAGEWDGGDDDEVEDHVVDDDDDDDADMSGSGASIDEQEDDLAIKQSLMVSLSYRRKGPSPSLGSKAKQEDFLKVNGFSSTGMANRGSNEVVHNGKESLNNCRPSPLRDVSAADTQSYPQPEKSNRAQEMVGVVLPRTMAFKNSI